MPFDFKFGFAWQYKDRKGDFTLVHRLFMENIKDWSKPLILVADDVLSPHVAAAFQTEGASDSVNWQELAPATVKRRGSAHPILHVSGALEQSFQKGGTDHVEEIGKLSLTWGSASPLALFHEFGTGGKTDFKRAGARKVVAKTKSARERYEASQAKPGGIPARPMLFYSKALAQQITDEMAAYALLISRQAGYKATYSPGEPSVTPPEAVQIGRQILSGV